MAPPIPLVPRTGLLEGADATGRAANPACGDLVIVSLRFLNGRIDGARFEACGCAAALAAAHAFQEAVEGCTVEQAAALDLVGAVARIRELPPGADVCAAVARRALAEALRALPRGPR